MKSSCITVLEPETKFYYSGSQRQCQRQRQHPVCVLCLRPWDARYLVVEVVSLSHNVLFMYPLFAMYSTLLYDDLHRKL